MSGVMGALRWSFWAFISVLTFTINVVTWIVIGITAMMVGALYLDRKG
jgi:hypothetical protein